MTKRSEGLKMRLKETAIKNRERFEYLKSKEHKTPEDWQEFHSLKDVKPYKKIKEDLKELKPEEYMF